MSSGSAAAWRWIEASVVLAVHDRQLAERGGADGIRDKGAIDSARPRNFAAHGNPDAADLAAAHIRGLTAGHPFVDGNKRTAWVAGRPFLADNGYRLDFDPLDAVGIMEGRRPAGSKSTVSQPGFARACGAEGKGRTAPARR